MYNTFFFLLYSQLDYQGYDYFNSHLSVTQYIKVMNYSRIRSPHMIDLFLIGVNHIGLSTDRILRKPHKSKIYFNRIETQKQYYSERITGVLGEITS